MVKKSVKKKKAKKVSEKSLERKRAESVKRKENQQLVWFFALIAVVFAAFLVPYFYHQSTKTFEFETIDWNIEKVGNVEVFHGRFSTLNPQIHIARGGINYHNIYLRNDPRENAVSVETKLDNFKFGGIVSISPAFDACRGDLPRVMVDFFDFLASGIGMAQITVATTNAQVANDTGKRLVDCSTETPQTVIVTDIGEENKIVRSSENPNCYVLTTNSCSDISVIEKFMVRTVSDFKDTHGEFVGKKPAV